MEQPRHHHFQRQVLVPGHMVQSMKMPIPVPFQHLQGGNAIPPSMVHPGMYGGVGMFPGAHPNLMAGRGGMGGSGAPAHAPATTLVGKGGVPIPQQQKVPPGWMAMNGRLVQAAGMQLPGQLASGASQVQSPRTAHALGAQGARESVAAVNHSRNVGSPTPNPRLETPSSGRVGREPGNLVPGQAASGQQQAPQLAQPSPRLTNDRQQRSGGLWESMKKGVKGLFSASDSRAQGDQNAVARMEDYQSATLSERNRQNNLPAQGGSGLEGSSGDPSLRSGALGQPGGQQSARRRHHSRSRRPKPASQETTSPQQSAVTNAVDGPRSAERLAGTTHVPVTAAHQEKKHEVVPHVEISRRPTASVPDDKHSSEATTTTTKPIAHGSAKSVPKQQTEVRKWKTKFSAFTIEDSDDEEVGVSEGDGGIERRETLEQSKKETDDNVADQSESAPKLSSPCPRLACGDNFTSSPAQPQLQYVNTDVVREEQLTSVEATKPAAPPTMPQAAPETTKSAVPTPVPTAVTKSAVPTPVPTAVTKSAVPTPAPTAVAKSAAPPPTPTPTAVAKSAAPTPVPTAVTKPAVPTPVPTAVTKSAASPPAPTAVTKSAASPPRQQQRSEVATKSSKESPKVLDKSTPLRKREQRVVKTVSTAKNSSGGARASCDKKRSSGVDEAVRELNSGSDHAYNITKEVTCSKRSPGKTSSSPKREAPLSPSQHCVGEPVGEAGGKELAKEAGTSGTHRSGRSGRLDEPGSEVSCRRRRSESGASSDASSSTQVWEDDRRRQYRGKYPIQDAFKKFVATLQKRLQRRVNCAGIGEADNSVSVGHQSGKSSTPHRTKHTSSRDATPHFSPFRSTDIYELYNELKREQEQYQKRRSARSRRPARAHSAHRSSESHRKGMKLVGRNSTTPPWRHNSLYSCTIPPPPPVNVPLGHISCGERSGGRVVADSRTLVSRPCSDEPSCHTEHGRRRCLYSPSPTLTDWEGASLTRPDKGTMIEGGRQNYASNKDRHERLPSSRCDRRRSERTYENFETFSEDDCREMYRSTGSQTTTLSVSDISTCSCDGERRRIPLQRRAVSRGFSSTGSQQLETLHRRANHRVKADASHTSSLRCSHRNSTQGCSPRHCQYPPNRCRTSEDEYSKNGTRKNYKLTTEWIDNTISPADDRTASRKKEIKGETYGASSITSDSRRQGRYEQMLISSPRRCDAYDSQRKTVANHKDANFSVSGRPRDGSVPAHRYAEDTNANESSSSMQGARPTPSCHSRRSSLVPEAKKSERPSLWAITSGRPRFVASPVVRRKKYRCSVPKEADKSGRKSQTPFFIVEEVRLDEQRRPYVLTKEVPCGAAALEAQRASVERLSKPRHQPERCHSKESGKCHNIYKNMQEKNTQ
ncbi:hypothetical protein TRVL_02217 [Trypanosoma vivax]|nr:hypothetical protein TRVL_02217 [Trypanosoma vivax]